MDLVMFLSQVDSTNSINVRCIFFIQHEKWEPSACSQNDSSTAIMRKIAELMRYRAVQGAIVFVTLSFFAVGIWGCTQITQVRIDEM